MASVSQNLSAALFAIALGASSQSAALYAAADPTLPEGYQAPASNSAKAKRRATLNLQSVMLQAGHERAIINGKTYREGDRVGAYRVKRISAWSVELSDASGARRTLQMFAKKIRKTGAEAQ